MSGSEEIAACQASGDKCVMRYTSPCSTHWAISELCAVGVYMTRGVYFGSLGRQENVLRHLSASYDPMF
jgi:hypothetical protein